MLVNAASALRLPGAAPGDPVTAMIRTMIIATAAARGIQSGRSNTGPFQARHPTFPVPEPPIHFSSEGIHVAVGVDLHEIGIPPQ